MTDPRGERSVQTERPRTTAGDTRSALLSTTDAAGLLGVSAQTVRELCASGDIGHHKIGRQIRISPESLDEYLAATFYPRNQ